MELRGGTNPLSQARNAMLRKHFLRFHVFSISSFLRFFEIFEISGSRKNVKWGVTKVFINDSVYKQKLPLFINYSLAKFQNQSQSARSDPFGVPAGFFEPVFFRRGAGEGPERDRLKKTPLATIWTAPGRLRLISEFCQRVQY